jgi:hypothetical protein
MLTVCQPVFPVGQTIAEPGEVSSDVSLSGRSKPVELCTSAVTVDVERDVAIELPTAGLARRHVGADQKVKARSWPKSGRGQVGEGRRGAGK